MFKSDPWLGFKVVEVEKTGWTDEARAASAIARQKGYKEIAGTPGLRQNFFRQGSGDKAHTLAVDFDGRWHHMEHTPNGITSSAHGEDTKSLETRLADVHKMEKAGDEAGEATA